MTLYKKAFALTGRNVWQNHAQEGAAIFHDFSIKTVLNACFLLLVLYKISEG